MSGKISPAFEPFLAGSGPNDKCDAIVIYRTPADDNPPPMSELAAVRGRRGASVLDELQPGKHR